jgi:hypothetical protein
MSDSTRSILGFFSSSASPFRLPSDEARGAKNHCAVGSRQAVVFSTGMTVSDNELALLQGKILQQDSPPYTRMFVNSLTYSDSEMTQIEGRYVTGEDGHLHLAEIIEHAKANIMPHFSIAITTDQESELLESEEVADSGNGNGKTEWEYGWSTGYNCPMWTNRATGEVEYDDVSDETDEIEDVTDETDEIEAVLDEVLQDVSRMTHITSLHYIALHCITLHYIALHCITLHYIALHYITSHYITIQYITLHYTTLHSHPHRASKCWSTNFECYSKCHFLSRSIDRIILLM